MAFILIKDSAIPCGTLRGGTHLCDQEGEIREGVGNASGEQDVLPNIHIYR